MTQYQTGRSNSTDFIIFRMDQTRVLFVSTQNRSATCSLKFRLTSTYSKFLFDGRTFFPFLHRIKFLVSPLLRTFLVTSNWFSSNPDSPSLLHVAHLGSIWPGWSFNSPKYDHYWGGIELKCPTWKIRRFRDDEIFRSVGD